MRNDFILTTSEAAEILSIGPSRVRQLIYDGTLTAVKQGRDLFLSVRSVTKAKGRKTLPGPLAKISLDK